MASQNENLGSDFKNTPITPELWAWALRQHSDEEVIAGLREAKEQGGPELGELIHELEHEVQTSEHRPHS
jgi:hypothetical protein